MASDGAGRYRPCRVRGGRHQFSLEADGPIATEPMPAPAITVAFSLVKADRAEWAAAKLAEIGVDRIVPLVCDRTVVRPGGERRRDARLGRIVRESAMQARLTRLPLLCPPVPLPAFMKTEDAAALSVAEPGGAPPDLSAPVVLVGPEGGWSTDEDARFDEVGARRVGLADSVLRVETAAVVAGGIFCALRIGLVGP